MSRKKDRLLARAREEAEGTELHEDPYADQAIDVEREGAQGVEVFEDPNATTPADTLRQGSPGHESLVGNDHDDPDDWPEVD